MRISFLSAVVLLSSLLLPGEVKGTEDVWQKLLLMVQNEQRPVGLRCLALDSACKNLAAEDEGELIELIQSWVSEIDEAGSIDEVMEQGSSLNAKYVLVQRFASRSGACVRSPLLDEPAMLDLWTLLATRSWLETPILEACYEFVARSPVIDELKQEAAIAILRDGSLRRQAVLPDSLFNLLDASALPAIRQIVRESMEDGEVNLGAASVLAHYGDGELLAGLEEIRSQKGDSDPALGRTLTWFLWQIRVQNASSGLLEHIASTDAYSPESRGWAIDRALERGAASSEIRQAILSCAASRQPPHRRHTRHLLDGLRSHGFARGVLEASDMPEVPRQPHLTYDKSKLLRHPQPYVPDLLMEIPAWEPQEENYDVLFEWMLEIPWAEIDPIEGYDMLKQKLCELSLSPPLECEGTKPTE